MTKRQRPAAPAPPVDDRRLHLVTALVGSIDGTPVLFSTQLWTELWQTSDVGQAAGGFLAILPGRLLKVDVWLIDETEEAERVAVARQGPNSGTDVDVTYHHEGTLPRGVGRA